MHEFIKEAFLTSISRGALFIVGVLTTIIGARLLGPEGNGLLTIACFLPSLIVSITIFGIPVATVYYTAQKEFSAAEILGNNIVLSLLIGLGSTLVGVIIILMFSSRMFHGVPISYLLFSLLMIPLTIFNSNLIDILLGLSKIMCWNILHLVHGLFGLGLIIILVGLLKMGVVGGIIGQVVASLLFGVIVLIAVYISVGDFSLKLNRAYLKKVLFYGAKSHAASVLAFLNYRIDVFLLNYFLTSVAVGLYSVSVAMVEKIWILSYAANLVLFPRLAAGKEEEKNKDLTAFVCRNILAITLLTACLVYSVSEWLVVVLYSSEFIGSVKPLQILLPGVVILTVWRTLANDFAARGRPDLNIYVNSLGVVVNLVLNLLLIPRIGVIGAAWASLASYAIAAVAALVIYIRISGNSAAKVLLPTLSDLYIYRSCMRDSFRAWQSRGDKREV